MTSSATAAPTQTSTGTWNIDPAHSIAEFKVKHMMIANVKGQFSKIALALAERGAQVIATDLDLRTKRKQDWSHGIRLST